MFPAPGQPDPATPPPGGRLNLLLTSGSWRAEPWVESLPALMEPMGVRAFHADAPDEAARLIREFPIHIAVVDLALPLARSAAVADEGGVRVLQILARLDSPPPTIVVQRPRARRDEARDLADALSRGVFAVLPRPVQMELLLDAFSRVLRRYHHNRWPGAPTL